MDHAAHQSGGLRPSRHEHEHPERLSTPVLTAPGSSEEQARRGRAARVDGPGARSPNPVGSQGTKPHTDRVAVRGADRERRHILVRSGRDPAMADDLARLHRDHEPLLVWRNVAEVHLRNPSPPLSVDPLAVHHPAGVVQVLGQSSLDQARHHGELATCRGAHELQGAHHVTLGPVDEPWRDNPTRHGAHDLLAVGDRWERRPPVAPRGRASRVLAKPGDLSEPRNSVNVTSATPTVWQRGGPVVRQEKNGQRARVSTTRRLTCDHRPR